MFSLLTEPILVCAGRYCVSANIFFFGACFLQDDEGLRVFQKDHFAYPIYRDENLDFYRAFGDKKVSEDISLWSLLNPFKIYRSLKDTGKRMKEKGLEGNLVGDGLKKGGIIVFGSDGEPKYAYPEITGSALETDDIVAALKDVSRVTVAKYEL